MVSHKILLATVVILIGPMELRATDCRVEVVEGAPTGVEPQVVEQLISRHIKLRMDDKYDLCEIWRAKIWTIDGATKPKGEGAPILYSLKPGSLVGVIRVMRPCLDLRGQDIPKGTYTLRYAIQPEFEAHKDSHDSRDFLLLVSCKVDKSPALIGDSNKLIQSSAESIAAMHPIFLPLLKVADADRQEPIRRDDRDPDGWILLLTGKAESGKSIPMEIIVPHAAPDA